jgi:hypothetical protein
LENSSTIGRSDALDLPNQTATDSKTETGLLDQFILILLRRTVGTALIKEVCGEDRNILKNLALFSK